jgi:adenylate cyclase
MSGKRVQRRLAAILAADVVGYSRLMGSDEEGTLARLKAHRRDIVDPRINEYRGRIVKTTGDGMLVEFASVVNALRCAMEIQRELTERTAEVDPEKRIALRIGINVGDIVVEDGDIYGDGVNVAARLEALAEPGGICVSARVQEDSRGKLDLAFEDLGEQRLKNIAWPVKVYRARLGREAATPLSGLELPDKLSIAVLPFQDMSGDAARQYLTDGITEDIITELSRYPELFVIARNSSFQYRDKAVDVRRVGQVLGVEYVVEGSLRTAGNRIRITAQLVDAATGSHLWAEHYDRDREDVFAIQDEVTQTIAATLVGRVAASGAEKARRKPTERWAAYDYFLQAQALNRRHDALAAEPLLLRAIEIDPRYAHAHSLLAYTYVKKSWHTGERTELLKKALHSAEKALSIDYNDGLCHIAMGFVCLSLRRFDQAEPHFDKAVELNPNSVTFAGERACWLYHVGRRREALEILDLVAQRDPLRPPYHWEMRATILFMERRYEEAIQTFARMNPLFHWDRAYLAAAYAYLGRDQEARAEIAEVLRLKPDYSIAMVAKNAKFKNEEDVEHLLTGLRMAGLPE